MNKGLIIGYLIFIATNVLGQDLPKKLKFDSSIYSGDSSYVAIIKGKNAGIFNLKKMEFAVPMAKNQSIVFSPYFNIFTVFNENGYKSYEAFNPELLKELNQYNTMVGGAKFEVSKLDDNKFLMTDIEYPFTGVDKDGVLSFDYDAPFEGSGVYNLETNTWEVPRNYTEIFSCGNALFALKYESTEYEYKKDIKGKSKYIGHYDIYLKNEKGQWTLTQENVKTLEQIPMKEVFGYETMTPIEDVPNHYLCQKVNGKKEYIIFDLFMDSFFWHPEVNLQIVRSDIDFASTQAEENLIITYASQDSLPIALYGYLKEKKPFDSSFVFTLEEGKTKVLYGVNDNETFKIYGDHGSRMVSMINFNEGLIKMNFGIRRLNDSLIKVYNSSFDKFKTLRSISYPMEDSININGGVVYQAQGSTSATGIYNVKTGNWEIEPLYYDCHMGKHLKLYGHLERYEDADTYHVEYDLIDDQGYEAYELLADSIADNLHIMQDILLEMVVDTLYRKSGESVYSKMASFYFQNKDGMGTIEIDDLMLGQYNIHGPAEFLYYNEDIDFSFMLENESIVLNFRDSTYSVQKNGFLQFEFDGTQSSKVNVKYANDGDTTSISYEDYLTYSGLAKASLKIDHNGRIIMNDSSSYFSNILNFDGRDYSFTYSLENSAIWEKSNGNWNKVSPFFANIQELPIGYSCKTGCIINNNWSEYLDGPQESARFILFDDEIKPISFVDFYDFANIEDLGFGLKVCTDKACMFVTYDFQVITQDEWDEFSLTPDGRLMAIRNPPNKVTDQGEKGSDGIVAYFEIPK